jgi:hypothetical protein
MEKGYLVLYTLFLMLFTILLETYLYYSKIIRSVKSLVIWIKKLPELWNKNLHKRKILRAIILAVYDDVGGVEG